MNLDIGAATFVELFAGGDAAIIHGNGLGIVV